MKKLQFAFNIRSRPSNVLQRVEANFTEFIKKKLIKMSARLDFSYQVSFWQVS